MGTLYRRQMIGTPVFKKDQEKVYAIVKDLVLDLTLGCCIGLAVEATGIWKSAKFLPWENVIAHTKKGYVITLNKPLRPLGKRRECQLAIHWLGMRLWGEQDADCGTVADIAISGRDHVITGIAKSAGLFADMSSGWSFIPWEQVEPCFIKNNKSRKGNKG